jgi:hypothetical protein
VSFQCVFGISTAGKVVSCTFSKKFFGLFLCLVVRDIRKTVPEFYSVLGGPFGL